jgi:multiple sugar transport system permease protein
MLPFFVIFSLFSVFPVLLSIILSYTSYNVFEIPQFLGWQNYINLFVNDDVFGIAVKNTLIFALITGPLSFFLSMFFAWVINEIPKGFREVTTLVFYAPSISGSVFTIWLIIFDADIYGYLNSFLLQFGFIREPVSWLQNPQYMMAIVIIVQLWVSLGTSFLAMRAGFATVDRQLYEAGMVDGVKNRWQELWYITLPSMTPHLLLSAILSITASFGVEAIPTAMTGFPSTGYATQTIMQSVRDYGFIRFERGYACAIATILFLLSIGSNKLVQSFLRRVGK